jgi:hypothetical protein
MPLRSWFRAGCGFLGAVLIVLLQAGCPRRPAASAAPKAKAEDHSASDMRLALDALRKLAEGTDEHPAQRTIFYLNEWISGTRPPAAEWKEDRLLAGVPRALRNTPGLERLAKLQFTADDIPYLQQTLWLHDIANRARQRESPTAMKAWLKEIESSVGLPEAEQLATAERLFDWTVRNLQLDALPPPPKGASATAGGAADDPVSPALQGELGPGYGHLPLQTLLYGHADAHERGRIFILLCRQAGIEAVMLGIKDKGSVAPRAWTPAVLVGGQLYLFEMSLALPIPGAEGKGIATLEQVFADPKLIRQLDVEGLAYPVQGDDLKTGEQSNVFALVDAEPAALSRRMQLLQAALPPAKRLALAVQPRQIELKLQTSKAISETQMWRVPFEAHLYQYGFHDALAKNPGSPAAVEFSRLTAVFASERPLAKARNFHLQGRFDNEDDNKAARALYMECRPPDNEMDKMLTSEYFRKMIGLDQALPTDPAQQKAYLDHFIAIARLGKFNATYWLALTYYESGKYETAIEWLGQRTVQAVPPSPWTPGARYNLARCYEQLGNVELARQWLLSDDESPQRHGNLLRAKQLASAK